VLKVEPISFEVRDWERRLGRVFSHLRATLADRDLSGRRFAVWKILGPNTVPVIEALLASGADVIAGSSHPNAVSDGTVAYLREIGVRVFAHNGMSSSEYKHYLAQGVAEKPDYILSSGGALLLACHELGWSPSAALEGTRTGTNRLAGVDVRFPIFDWNDSPLKNAIEHRFHVAESFWSAFAYLTGMSLFGRKVLVVGFGPVGKGICERARNLGAHVVVADASPIRSAEAVFHGHAVGEIASSISDADIVVTVTGRDNIITPDHYLVARAGAVFANAGHSARELSIDWIRSQNPTPARSGIEVFNAGGKELLLLCRGDAINLASGAGPFGTDMWDIFNGLIIRGAHWIAGEMPADTPRGLHPFPLALQNEVAAAFLEARGLLPAST
jgi:adenosylhomocysteinase